MVLPTFVPLTLLEAKAHFDSMAEAARARMDAPETTDTKFVNGANGAFLLAYSDASATFQSLIGREPVAAVLDLMFVYRDRLPETEMTVLSDLFKRLLAGMPADRRDTLIQEWRTRAEPK
jgi:hypothetical protein